jgi:hypothetical protein
MTLIDEIFALCKKLPDDWAALLKAHGLDIRKADGKALKRELTKKPLKVNRNIRGFADFAEDEAFGIVPRRPAHSLFYHALASPIMQTGVDGKLLSWFPSLDEIELVENYVFGVDPPTLAELLTDARVKREKSANWLESTSRRATVVIPLNAKSRREPNSRPVRAALHPGWSPGR